jgi:AcrR family transcriptional regulator
METLSVKQREIREREIKILDLARPMIAAGGITALSMEAIAAEIRIAKGTVYNHFANKEEIVLALAVQAVEQRLALFNHAVLMRGKTRERVAAIGLACEFYADRYCEFFQTEILVRNENLLEKTSPRRQEVLRTCEGRCMHAVAGVVRDAVACGDLELAPSHSVEDIVFGLWSLVYGGLMIEATSPSLADVGIQNARLAIRQNCNAMLDGVRWRPLYNAEQYQKWADKVSKNLHKAFPTPKRGGEK